MKNTLPSDLKLPSIHSLFGDLYKLPIPQKDMHSPSTLFRDLMITASEKEANCYSSNEINIGEKIENFTQPPASPQIQKSNQIYHFEFSIQPRFNYRAISYNQNRHYEKTNARLSIDLSSEEKRNKVPRPANAFMIYRREKQVEVYERLRRSKKELIGNESLLLNSEVSRVIGQMWRNETNKERDLYYQKAKEVLREHQRIYPNYRSRIKK